MIFFSYLLEKIGLDISSESSSWRQSISNINPVFSKKKKNLLKCCLPLYKYGLCLGKTCLWAYADSKDPDQTAHMRSLIRAFLSANRITEYYRMYEWRAKPQMILAHAQDDLNLLIRACLKALYFLDAAHMAFLRLKHENCTFAIAAGWKASSSI